MKGNNQHPASVEARVEAVPFAASRFVRHALQDALNGLLAPAASVLVGGDRETASALATAPEHRLTVVSEDELALRREEQRFDLVIDLAALAQPARLPEPARLGALANSSRDLVCVVAPNPSCYWYWAAAAQSPSDAGAARPGGPEELLAALRAAGVTPVAFRYVAVRETEQLIRECPGIAPSARADLVEVHRSALVPVAHRALAIAAYGTVAPDATRAPAEGWEPAARRAEAESADAAVAAPEAREAASREVLLELQHALTRAQSALDAFRASPTYRTSRFISRVGRDLVGVCIGTARWVSRGGRGSTNGLLEAIHAADPAAEIEQLLRSTAEAAQALAPGDHTGAGLQPAGRAAPSGGAPAPRRHGLKRLAPLAGRARAAAKRRALEGLRLAKTPVHRAQLERILAEHPEAPVVVFPPLLPWNAKLFQRPHHVARLLGERGYLYFFCSPDDGVDAIDGFAKLGERCYLTDRYDLLVAMKRQKTHHLYSTDLGLAPPIPRTWEFIEGELARGNRVLYEYIDEIHPAVSGRAIPAASWLRHERLLDDPRVVVVASATKLMNDVLRHRRDRCALVTNGVEYEHFARRFSPEEAPEAMKPVLGRGKPIVGYFGALATWFDYELVLKLARERDYSVVLLGMDYDRSIERSGLSQCPNVFLPGSIPYPELPRYAALFDVSTIPFRINEVTLSTSPIKLFEYMALGHPIVTTDLPECRKYRSVLIGKTHEEFLAQVDTALGLREDRAYGELLRADALANTWGAKVDAIVALLGT